MSTTILLVDDSASLRGIAKVMLEQAGYRVIEAADGVEALLALNQHAVDLVVTDLSMPRLDGLSLLKQIKSHKRYQALPVVFLSTESMALRKEEARRAGARAWIVKPARPAELLGTVARCLAPVPAATETKS